MLLCGCNGPSGEQLTTETALSVTPQEITVGADAGRAEFVVEASDDWNLSGIPDWCGFVRPDRGGAGKTTVSVGGKFYEGESDRTATMTVTCGTRSLPVTLVQQGKRTIRLTPDRIGALAYQGETFEVMVEANFTFEVEIRQEGEAWLQRTGNRQEGDGLLSFKALPNPGIARTAVIVFRDIQSDYEAELSVTQQGDPYQQDRAVLEELYRTAGGPSWTRNDKWNTDSPIEEWYGIEVDGGRVAGISLPDNNMVGTLPASLGDMALQELVLRGNRLSGSLPSGLRTSPYWKDMDAAAEIYPQADGYGFSLADGEVTCFQKATKGNGVNIVFLGDGFTSEDMVLGSGFDAMVERSIAAFFGVEPMTAYRAYFNVYSVAAVSQDRGIGVQAAKNTKFRTYFTGLVGATMTTDATEAYNYVAKSPVSDYTKTLVIMLANTTKYGGTTLMWDDNRAISICPDYPVDNPEHVTAGGYGLEGLVRHEAIGHGFAKLDEEYMTTYTGAPDAGYVAQLIERHRRGYSLNIDTDNNPETVCWSHFIGRSGYEKVGVFEGGGGYPRGVWRPEEQPSCMQDNRPYFNAPSREQIVRRIMTLAGETYDFDEFVRQDISSR